MSDHRTYVRNLISFDRKVPTMTAMVSCLFRSQRQFVVRVKVPLI